LLFWEISHPEGHFFPLAGRRGVFVRPGAAWQAGKGGKGRQKGAERRLPPENKRPPGRPLRARLRRKILPHQTRSRGGQT